MSDVKLDSYLIKLAISYLNDLDGALRSIADGKCDAAYTAKDMSRLSWQVNMWLREALGPEWTTYYPKQPPYRWDNETATWVKNE